MHKRKSIRLREYDYSSAAGYFVTICTAGHEHLLGRIADDSVVLNHIGQIVHESWCWLATKYLYVALDDWIIMPNHLHGIIFLLPMMQYPPPAQNITSSLPDTAA